MLKFLQTNKLLITILIVASFLRFYGLNWDQGQHFHPDERMIIMVAERISFQDLNPHFFAYGSLPIYLLKITGTIAGIFDSKFATYDSLNLVGRLLSTLFDLGTLIILYFLGKKLINQEVGLLASFLYAISVLPIQLSHFYAVDTPLTFFILTTLYFILDFVQKPKIANSLLMGFFTGLSLATKTSAVLLLIPLGLVFLIKFKADLSWRNPHFQKNKALFLLLILMSTTLVLAFLMFEPFAFIDFPTFWHQTLEQQQMTKSAFTFPYTLQYVGKVPYLYELKNIFLWGLGPILATLSFAGTIFLTLQVLRNLLIRKYSILNLKSFILLTFFWLYFAIVGHFAIGFMRYMLPIYPLLCLFATILVYQIYLFLKPRFSSLQFYILHSTFYIFLIIWPLSFISIYSQPNTRNSATDWILKNVPPESTIAVEHWDDGLPVGNQSLYKTLILPMYDPDTPIKWAQVNQILSTTNYIIIASNRLYVPLQKLTDCQNLPTGRCYKQTAEYYKKLFNGALGFRKVAEFFVYPTIPLLDYTISDFTADESFTVYDHPKVMIYENVNHFGPQVISNLLSSN